MSELWLRKASLIISTGGEGLDVSDLRFTFDIRQKDYWTPNVAAIRVYNLSDDTANRIQKEFTRVSLSAGYRDGPYGLLFDGTLVQVKRSRENPTDKYLDLICADGDPASLFSRISVSLDKGTTFKDRADALTKAITQHGVTAGQMAELPDRKLPRGRVYFGATRDHIRQLGKATSTTWSMQNGKLQSVADDGYLPGEAVVMNSTTGMIGLPEQTSDGIHVKCLLNTRIRIGGRIQINEASIQQADVQLANTEGAKQENTFLPKTTTDGFYRVMVAEHQGDTRGTPWYTSLVCVGIREARPVPQLNQGRV